MQLYFIRNMFLISVELWSSIVESASACQFVVAAVTPQSARAIADFVK